MASSVILEVPAFRERRKYLNTIENLCRSDAARVRRARRELASLGFRLVKSRVRDWCLPEWNTYRIFNTTINPNEQVFGEWFLGADILLLDEVEAFVEASAGN